MRTTPLRARLYHAALCLKLAAALGAATQGAGPASGGSDAGQAAPMGADANAQGGSEAFVGGRCERSDCGVPTSELSPGASDADRAYAQWLSRAAPNAFYPEACNSTVTFNDPGSWAHGNASLTVALLSLNCAGVSRVLHWHHDADEWGYVRQGEILTYIVSPDGLPWPVSTSRLGRHGVWYFPRGWLHGFACVARAGGCKAVLVFNTPVAVPIDNHNLDTTLAQAPDAVAAGTLGMSVAGYRKGALPHFADSTAGTASTSPLLTLARGACDPECPPVALTSTSASAMPAAMNLMRDGQAVELPGGVRARDMRTQQFPFAKTLSQELMLLPPAGLRASSWVINANALLVATEGAVRVQLQGGVTDATAHEAFQAELGPGDAFYIPRARSYIVRETSGARPAAAVVTFDTGSWRSVELGESLRLFPAWIVSSNLRGAPAPFAAGGEGGTGLLGMEAGTQLAQRRRDGEASLQGAATAFLPLLLGGVLPVVFGLYLWRSAATSGTLEPNFARNSSDPLL